MENMNQFSTPPITDLTRNAWLLHAFRLTDQQIASQLSRVELLQAEYVNILRAERDRRARDARPERFNR